MAKKTKISERREKIREEYFSDLKLWTAEDKGWFRAPRTLPLVLALLKHVKGQQAKNRGGQIDPTSTYLELWSRHHGEGIIEMSQERDHAFAAGYEGERAVRTWQERMRLLEEQGLIKVIASGNIDYKYVGLIHPADVLLKLKEKNLIHERWLNAYKARIIETKEPSFEEAFASPQEASPEINF